MLIGGALVNALAFTGSNYLFSMLRSSGVDEECKHHDEAVEQLQAAQATWSRKLTERLDWINEELRRQDHAVQTFRDVDAAMREYAQVTGHNQLADITWVAAKKTARSPLSSWGWPRPAWWPTDLPSNLHCHAVRWIIFWT